jgi:hypothetical protein
MIHDILMLLIGLAVFVAPIWLGALLNPYRPRR